jgi:hypothetical protein
MPTKSTHPVTRETNAYVRDRGLRPLIVTLVGSVLELRPKGLRSHETIDLAGAYLRAVQQRVAREKAERKAARKGKARPAAKRVPQTPALRRVA